MKNTQHASNERTPNFVPVILPKQEQLELENLVVQSELEKAASKRVMQKKKLEGTSGLYHEAGEIFRVKLEKVEVTRLGNTLGLEYYFTALEKAPEIEPGIKFSTWENLEFGGAYSGWYYEVRR